MLSHETGLFDGYVFHLQYKTEILIKNKPSGLFHFVTVYTTKNQLAAQKWNSYGENYSVCQIKELKDDEIPTPFGNSINE